jgi:short-subunit dehydrogenase
MNNPIVLITGGGSGLGFEIAKLFALDNYSLILVGRNVENLESAQKELKQKYQVDVEIISADLTDYQAVSSIFPRLKERGIQVDILVNNAGFGLLGDFINLDVKQQLEIIDLNIRALTSITYHFLQQASVGAKILNISSMAAFQPGPGMSVYYATKAFVSSFSEALSEELVKQKITVTSVCPGPIDTNFWKVSRSGREKVADTTAFASLKPSFVAKSAYRGFEKGRRVVVPGVLNKLLVLIVKIIPRSLVLKAVRHLNSRI